MIQWVLMNYNYEPHVRPVNGFNALTGLTCGS